jgi:uncharacterized protein (TIGR02270 family)
MTVGAQRAAPPFVDAIVSQHVDEAGFLWSRRRAAVGSPNFSLRELAAHDERLVAHLDGLRVAAEHGWRRDRTDVAYTESGALFVATLLALEAADGQGLQALLSCAEEAPAQQEELISAFGWISARFLKGVAKQLLGGPSSFSRRVGIACCAMHGVDPGLSLDTAMEDADPALRTRSLHAASELGRIDLVGLCDRHRHEQEVECRFAAIRSLVLLGNRGSALDDLSAIGTAPVSRRGDAFRLALQTMTVRAAHSTLQSLAESPEDLRWLIHGSGIAGDRAYVPWLIGHMTDPRTSRLAGEAFSLITGTDLVELNLERVRPEGFESGPSDDPQDLSVAVDPDDGLPWPDPAPIEKWWAANEARFQKGARYFMGAPVTREHCIDVLKTGYQRQRVLAAHYLCLLDPGTPLFNTSAPAWRQQRLLAKMT